MQFKKLIDINLVIKKTQKNIENIIMMSNFIKDHVKPTISLAVLIPELINNHFGLFNLIKDIPIYDVYLYQFFY
jgi:hypothetical protein